MSDLGDAAARIGDKITELLDVFDLSFFMSGAVTTAAILLMLPDSVPNPMRGEGVPGAAIFGLVLGSYVLGLLCFALGRPLRSRIGLPVWALAKRGYGYVAQRLFNTPSNVVPFVEHELIVRALQTQGLSEPELRRYFAYPSSGRADRASLMALYTRMWVHVRSYSSLSESFALLKRYWMLSAAYDGIAIAALLWLVPIWLVLAKAEIVSPWLLTGAVVMMALACWHRAQQYKNYQIEELVATIAHWLSVLGRKELEGVADRPTLESAGLPGPSRAPAGLLDPGQAAPRPTPPV